MLVQNDESSASNCDIVSYGSQLGSMSACSEGDSDEES